MKYFGNEEDEEFSLADFDLNTDTPPSIREDQEQYKLAQAEIDDTADEVLAAEGMQKAAAVAHEPLVPNEQEPPPELEYVDADDGMPVATAAPAEEAPVAPQGKYSKMLEEYANLQKNSQRQKYINGIIRASQKMGQAFAGSVNGNFKVDPAGMDALDKAADAGPDDYVNKMKAEQSITGLRDEDQMRSPTSKVSEFYRLMARNRGMEVTDEMSAWDLAQMSKVMGAARPPRPPQKANFRNNKDGKDYAGVFEDGYYKDRPGGTIYDDVSPFQSPFYLTNQTTGGTLEIDKSTGSARPLNVPTPSVSSPESKSNASNEPMTYIPPSQLYADIAARAPKDAQDIKKEQDEYKKAAEVPLNVLSIADSIDMRLDKAMTNPQEVPQIKAQLAYLAEKAPKSDEDFARYVSDQGLLNKIETFLPKGAQGVLSQEQVNGLRQMIRNSKKGAMDIAHKRRDSAAKNMRLVTKGLRDDQLKGLLYELPGDNEITRKTSDGRIIVYDKYTKKPLREVKP
jgi:uncharacterized membrane protein